MKFLISACVIMTMLAVTSCDSVDKELVSSIQNDIKVMDGLSAPIAALGTSVNNLAQQVNAAPEGMKAENDPDFNDLVSLSEGLVQKQQSTLAEYNDLMAKLKSLVADYSAGKLKTEQVRAEYENLKTGMQGVSDLVGRMSAMTDQMQAQFAKMSADWNAKAEGHLNQ